MVLEHPTEQDRVNLVRIDEVPVLVGGTDAVRIAIRAQAGLAAVGHHSLAQRANVRLNRLGMDAAKERIGIGANLHVSHADAGKNIGDEGAPGAVH